MESRVARAARLFPFYIGAATVAVSVAAPGLPAPGTLFLAYAKQGKDDDETRTMETVVIIG